MLSKKRIFKSSSEACEGNEECKSSPKFRVSSCPFVPLPKEVPEPVFTSAYGSLYRTTAVIAVTGAYVDFDTVGPSSGTTLDIVNNSITVNSSGIYTITFSTKVNAVGLPATPQSVFFILSINGIPIPEKETAYQTETLNFIKISTISRTDQLMLNQGDIIQIRIVVASPSISYDDSALVVTKVA